MITIGIDISTSIVGISCINEKQQIKYISHIDLRKVKSADYGTMADLVQLELNKIKSTFPNESFSIFVEEAGKKYKMGTSSAATIFMLARFNGIVCYCAYKTFGTLPIELDVKKARKSLGLSISSQKATATQKKKQIKLDVIDFLLNIKLYSPDDLGITKTTYGNWQEWSYDRADSLVIALAGHAHLFSSRSS